MDEEKRDKILAHISEQVNALNIHALGVYARLLKQCGVRELRIFREFFLP